MKHYSDEELILHYYGEDRRPAAVEAHLADCAECAANYRGVAGTLAMVPTPDAPERGETYGLEVWQRIRHRLPEQGTSSWWSRRVHSDRLVLVAVAASLVLAAFVAGRFWPQQPDGSSSTVERQTTISTPDTTDAADVRRRVLLASVADHFDRAERVLTEIVNASDRSDISGEQGWATDLLMTSRLYRQDAVDAGEQSVASVLDDVERSLLEIVHSPSPIDAADLEQIRRRIDAAALLFKVRVMSDELWRRESALVERSRLRPSTARGSGQS